MDASFTVDTLTEELFSRLCNIALEKCHDKVERRRAGCGGHSMRKRILIKNFVADLLRSQNEGLPSAASGDEKSSCGEDSDEWEEELEEGEEIEMDEVVDEDDLADESSDDEDDDDSEECSSSDPVPLPPLTAPPARTFVDSDPSLSSLFPNYLENSSETVSAVRDGAMGRAEGKLSSEDRLWMYDGYGSDSESAHTGQHPSAWTPQDCWSSAHTYDGISSSCVDVDTLQPPSSFYEQSFMDAPASYGDALATSLFAQPVRAEAQDQLFLSLSTNHLAEMKAYSPDMALPDDVCNGGTYTDLDAPAAKSISESASVVSSRSEQQHGCKRVAHESASSLFDSINSQLAPKRIKL